MKREVSGPQSVQLLSREWSMCGMRGVAKVMRREIRLSALAKVGMGGQC